MTKTDRVLVTGPTGFLGKHIVRGLLAEGFDVAVATRRPLPDPMPVQTYLIDNLDENTAWSTILDGVHSVVHLAGRAHRRAEVQDQEIDLFRSVNVLGTEHLAREAVKAGVNRFIYMSSIAVNGSNTTGRPAFRPGDPPAPRTSYGMTKLEAETALARVQSTAPRTAFDVIRSPVVIGREAPGNLALLDWVIRKGLPMPFSSIHNRRAFLDINDLVQFIVLRLRSEGAGLNCFTLASPDLISTPDLVRRLAQVQHINPRLIPFPVGILRSILNLLRRTDKADALIEDLEIDRNAALAAGWTGQTSIPDALARAYGK